MKSLNWIHSRRLIPNQINFEVAKGKKKYNNKKNGDPIWKKKTHGGWIFNVKKKPKKWFQTK